MERLTRRTECGDAYYPECYERCYGEGASEKCNDCDYNEKICDTLAGYEDTGLTPDQVMELKEAVQRLDKIFGDEITVNQVIDFFTDFYVAQGDDERVEAAELLTNEEVERYRRLKERDTAKAPIDIEDNYGFFVCPSCGNSIYASDDFESHKFCLNCGQRIRWEE